MQISTSLLQAWDKMDRAIGTKRVALGILFLTETLEITVEEYKDQHLLAITQGVWAAKHTRFNAVDTSQLIGNVIVCVQVCLWLQCTCISS